MKHTKRVVEFVVKLWVEFDDPEISKADQDAAIKRRLEVAGLQFKGYLQDRQYDSWTIVVDDGKPDPQAQPGEWMA